MVAVQDRPASAPEQTAYPVGYVDGYRAGLDALAVLLCDPCIGVDEAIRRADDHLVTHLFDWRFAGADPTPPVFRPFAPRGGHDPLPSAPESGHDSPYAEGYLEGWDKALDHMGALVSLCHAPRFTAIDVMRDYIRDALTNWLEYATGSTPRAPELELPRLLRRNGLRTHI